MEDKLLGKEIFNKHKKTKHREKIIEILNLFELPATAEDVFIMFSYFKEKISLSTVYRNMELLSREGIVKKSIVMDTNKVRFELNRQQDNHYIICIKCNKMKPLDFCPMDNENDLAKKTGYKITGHKFEVYGFCPDCS